MVIPTVTPICDKSLNLDHSLQLELVLRELSQQTLMLAHVLVLTVCHCPFPPLLLFLDSGRTVAVLITESPRSDISGSWRAATSRSFAS